MPESGSGDDRRRTNLRVPLRAKFRMEFEERRYFLSEHAFNISTDGAFVRTEAKVEVGEKFLFESDLTRTGPRICGTAEVIWVRKESGGASRPEGMGVRFRQIDEPGAALLERLEALFVEQGVEAMKEGLAEAAREWEKEHRDESSTTSVRISDLDLPETKPMEPIMAQDLPVTKPLKRVAVQDLAEEASREPGAEGGRSPTSNLDSAETEKMQPVSEAEIAAASALESAETETMEPISEAEVAAAAGGGSSDAPSSEGPRKRRDLDDTLELEAVTEQPSDAKALSAEDDERTPGGRTWLLLVLILGLLVTALALGPRLYLGSATSATIGPGETYPGDPAVDILLSRGAKLDSPVAVSSEDPDPFDVAAIDAAEPMSLEGFNAIEAIDWFESDSELRVEIKVDGFLPPESFNHYRLPGETPREVIQIFGVLSEFPERVMAVDSRLVERIRTGFHRRDSRNEARIVLDLTDANATVTSIETDGTSLQVYVSIPVDGIGATS